MKLEDFAGILPVGGQQIGSIAVAGLSSDSRTVQPGFLFFAIAGAKADGAGYAADAEKHGAAAIIAARGCRLSTASIPVIETDEPRRALALAAARFYGAQPEIMVAVTGTAGKTSVASFTRQIWES